MAFTEGDFVVLVKQLWARVFLELTIAALFSQFLASVITRTPERNVVAPTSAPAPIIPAGGFNLFDHRANHEDKHEENNELVGVNHLESVIARSKAEPFATAEDEEYYEPVYVNLKKRICDDWLLGEVNQFL